MVMLFHGDLEIDIPKGIAEWLTGVLALTAPKVLGTDARPWPKVIVSGAPPPAFTHKTTGDGPWDTEKWLGCYDLKLKTITLWMQGIQRVSQEIGVEYNALLNCVLAHELGHWFNHQAPVVDGTDWEEDSIARYRECQRYDEVWAQWFSWWYGHAKDRDALVAFEKLEAKQSEPYRAWRWLFSSEKEPTSKSYKQEDLRNFGGRDFDGNLKMVLSSLQWSRAESLRLKEPARFDEPGSNVNMLTHLEKQRIGGVIDAVRDQFPPDEDITGW